MGKAARKGRLGAFGIIGPAIYLNTVLAVVLEDPHQGLMVPHGGVDRALAPEP